MIQWSADNKFFDYFAILLLVLCVFATVVGAIKNGPINASGPLEGVNERGSASVGEGSELLRNRKYLSCFSTSSVIGAGYFIGLFSTKDCICREEVSAKC